MRGRTGEDPGAARDDDGGRVPEHGCTVAEVATATSGRVRGDAARRLTAATHDSRRVGPGTLFVCVPGAVTDGHDFAAAAVAAGAAALLVERELALDVPQVVVPDARAAMGPAAAAVHGNPGASLRLAGVTGTNGKTTVVSLLGHVLAVAGRATDVIGTLTGERTTPEATDLQAHLAEDVARGVTDVAMEVSSHALVLHRVEPLTFDVAVFTNLGLDHLDFHGTPEAYFAAKAMLFEPERCRTGVANVDDVHGRLLVDSSGGRVRPSSIADAGDLVVEPPGWRFRWRGHPVRLPVPGRHNVTNALLALEAAALLGVDPAVAAAALADAPGVPGRFEVIRSDAPFAVVVDYAHTPDALDTVLVAADDLRGPGGATRVVFGCGGDRDRTKRPLMGEVAARRADRVVFTDDNPRSEDPAAIRAEIRVGADRVPEVERRATEVTVVPDRAGAIAAALGAAGPGDVVVLAGKGHEQGQTAGGVTVPFDDREAALAALAALGHGPPGSAS
ncbi:MAG: UDP-N-acetylmuramoyl-L-alanyl-D-glutamate--2,6-diaminopimelate ligase [Microthrixaceae bacterium]